jgi:SpoVK/Ycf46/Vps4 family AAA+-type ATPase
VLALFVGASGTGKTMAAEALAGARGVDLYRVDLAALVSKWVGETEQNLSRIFTDAERARCMLFFDEADAIFGRRGEVKEARDRWANLEVNYLLQRVEDFTGVVILATNFRQNIDEAFLRRVHVVAEFPMPDAGLRRGIWAGLLPDPSRHSVTAAELDELADRFELSGGNIRNVVLDACFRAVKTPDRVLTVRHLVASAAREYQKIGHSVSRGEFGPVFYEWAMEDVIAPTLAAEPAGV